MRQPLSRRGFLTMTTAAIGTASLGELAFASPDARDAATASEYVDVQLVNITDLHGYLQDAPASDRYVTGAGGQTLRVGGVAYLAAHLERIRAGHQNSIFFAPGDNFSGWEIEAESMADESTIEALNRMGLGFSTAGNHEFDKSPAFLTRHMEQGIPFGEIGWTDDFLDSTGRRFHGASFRYYSANVVWAHNSELVLPPYNIEWVDAGHGRRLPIGFIHITVAGTETGSTSFQPALRTLDELDTVNSYAAELKRRGVNAIVVVMHDGAVAGNDFNSGTSPSGPAYDLARAASPDIAAIVTGHWHCRFNMMVPDPNGVPRPLVEAGCYGQLINEINLRLDPDTGEVVRELTVSTNHANTRDISPDPALVEIADYWTAQSARRALIPIAKQTASFDTTRDSTGESSMGDLAADWALWCGRLPIQPMNNGNDHPNVPADLALIAVAPRVGSTVISGGLPYSDGTITFGDAWGRVGYGDPVLTATVTGAALHDVLEQQWTTSPTGQVVFSPLAVSGNVSYTFDANGAVGDRVDPADVLIEGRPLDVTRTYRLASMAYTFLGADGFPALGGFSDPVRHIRDFEGFIAYLRSKGTISPSKLDRIAARGSGVASTTVSTTPVRLPGVPHVLSVPGAVGQLV